jgi:hypothetical protein
MPRQLYPKRKRPLYPLDRRLGENRSQSGRGGKEKNSQPLSGLELPIIQPAAQRYTTELSPLLPVILYERQFWSLTLMKEYSLRVFENRVLRRIIGPKLQWREAGEDCMMESFINLYVLSNIIMVSKSRRMRWAGQVARMRGMRNAYIELLSENLKGREHSEDVEVGGKIILEWILGKWVVRCGIEALGTSGGLL